MILSTFSTSTFVRLVQHRKLSEKFVSGSVWFGIDNPRNITFAINKMAKSNIGVANVYYNARH